MATFLLRLDDEEKAEWAARAKREGRSLNQQIIATMRLGSGASSVSGTDADRAEGRKPGSQTRDAGANPRGQARSYTKEQSTR